MSASRERKMRSQQSQNTEPAKKTKKKKLSEGWILAICVVLVLAIVFGSIFVYRTIQNNKTVLTVGEHEISVKEFNYFYSSFANQMGSIISYLGVESGVALDEQSVDLATAQNWGYVQGEVPTDELTWAHVFAYSAMSEAARTYAYYDDAMANGFADDHVAEEVDKEIAEMEAYAAEQGISLDDLLESNYGPSADEDSYREYLRVSHIASHYYSETSSTKQYTREELDAHFNENADSFTYASYYLYTVNASEFVAEPAEGEEKADPTKIEQGQAKEAAEAMAAEFDVTDKKVSVKAEQLRSTVASTISEDAANWLFDEAAKGDVKMFATSTGNTYYVLKLIDNQDYQTVNALSITISADAEELAEGEKTAAEKISAIKDALAADASEESFRKLMEEYANEGSTEELNAWARGNMANVSADALIWASVEDRNAGDYEVFEGTDATTFVFFLGYEKSYRDTQINNTLISNYFTAILDAALANCGYDEAAAMKGNVGLAYNG